MNRVQVLFHLKEARDAIDQVVRDIESSSDYDHADYWVDLQHVYHHLNTAWNSHDATQKQIDEATDSDFNLWSALPADLPMMTVRDRKP